MSSKRLRARERVFGAVRRAPSAFTDVAESRRILGSKGGRLDMRLFRNVVHTNVG